MNLVLLLGLCTIACSNFVLASIPEGSKFRFNFTEKDTEPYPLPKSFLKGAKISTSVHCYESDANVVISWAIVYSDCYNISEPLAEINEVLLGKKYFSSGAINYRSPDKTYSCNDHILLEPRPGVKSNSTDSVQPLYIIPIDGIYIFGIYITSNGTVKPYKLVVSVDMKNDYGYLSAIDLPLLQFYWCMCTFYIFLGLLWMALSIVQWRDLLRVQFWIGGVIFLGMLEKATFYAEYHHINNVGEVHLGAFLFAEWVSCAKRTVARMLVIIVSLGFGIVKPRLGSALHRVVGVGVLYFILAALEAYMRIMSLKNDRTLLVASLPLAVLDSAICFWIFTALVNTTRTLRLRRNEVKLSLYRHFTNILVFAVIASAIYHLYALKVHVFVVCLSLWKDLWIDEAFWHILFSALLLGIMILWRPTNNNQRYAFVPLLETGDDEEEEHLVHDAYGVKIRMQNQKSSTSNGKQTNSVDDDIKWLEENVRIEPALPIIDSEDEMANTRFEISKMQ